MTWVNIENGNTGLDIRTKLNNFNNAAVSDSDAKQTTIDKNTNRITVAENDIVTVKGDISTHKSRLDILEGRHVLLLNCISTATTQEPVSVDSPIQVEYGIAQDTADVSMAANGALTFNTSGNYQINIDAHYGRTDATGTSVLLFRVLKNNVNMGDSLAAKISSSTTLVPWSRTMLIAATAGDVITTQLMRDSAGDNSGGLSKVSPTLAGWNAAPCISMQIYKV